MFENPNGEGGYSQPIYNWQNYSTQIYHDPCRKKPPCPPPPPCPCDCLCRVLRCVLDCFCGRRF